MAETTEQYRTRINQLKTGIENEPYIKKMRENIAEGISETGNRQADIEEQFQEVIDNTTGKDVISAPELIAARNGEANLKARLDKEQQDVNAQLAEKASKLDVGKIANGTPLFANDVSGMTDTSRLYMNKSDKYIYSHNGANWTSTGVIYQEKGISNDSIDTRHVSELAYLNKWVHVDGMKATEGLVNFQFDATKYNTQNIAHTIVLKFAIRNAVNLASGYGRLFANNVETLETIVGGISSGYSNFTQDNADTTIKTLNIAVPANSNRYYKVLIGVKPIDTQLPMSFDITDLSIQIKLSDGTLKDVLIEGISKMPNYHTNINEFGFDMSGVYLINNNGVSAIVSEELQKAPKTPSVLNGKIGVFIGDSITEANRRTLKNYHAYIAEKTGLITKVYGQSGTGYYGRYNVANDIVETPSFITVFLGTNDFGDVGNKNLPLGVLGDVGTSTVAGCIYTTLNNLTNKFPKVPIGVITPLPRADNYGSNATPNAEGYTLEQLSDLIIKHAKHFSMPYLDLYHESSLPVWNATGNDYYFKPYGYATPDGLHPNDAGHMVLAGKIEPWISSNLISY